MFEDTNSVAHKKSELRLYCDLMMQQVHAVKSAANAENGPEIQVLIKTLYRKYKIKRLIIIYRISTGNYMVFIVEVYLMSKLLTLV